MFRFRHHAATLLTIHAGLLLAGAAHAGSWATKAPFGAPLQGDLYTPTTPAASPAVLVVIHMCTGHSSTVHGWFDSFADQHGFYLIAPDAGKQCFDSSATRDGDRAAIVKMVDYVVTNKNADKSRVFAAGMSSGGCMTNTLLAIYPDVFAGGSAMPGFPAGGWPAGDTTCTKCSSSPPSTDGKYWGDIARKAFSWSGKYGCSQQWVGGGDEYNFNGWLPAVAAQFQNLSNLSAGTAGTGAPSGWTRTVYKDSDGNVRLETNLGPTSQKHDLENQGSTLYGNVVKFLGLDQASGACGVASTGAGGMTGAGGASMGGATSSGGMSGGGRSAMGGAPNGGTASSAGGMSATGGNFGGAGRFGGGAGNGTGGTSNGTGGTGNGTGGTVGTTGGTVGTTGGTAGTTGGSVGTTGGTVGTTGGTGTGTGGSVTTTGGTSTGGKGGATGSGGASTTGGTHSTSGTNAGDDSNESGGCSIGAPRSTQGRFTALVALGLGVVFARRRRSRH